MEKTTCTLCALSLPKNPVQLEGNPFCCNGCLVVYKILSAQGITSSFTQQPLMQRALEAGLISHPEALQKKEEKGLERKKLYFQIDNLVCPACGEAISLLLQKKRGIKSAHVDYLTDFAVVEYNPHLLGKEEIFTAIKKLGYVPKPPVEKEEKQKGRIPFYIAGFLSMNLMMLAVPLYVKGFGIPAEGYETILGYASFLLSIPLLFYCAMPIWKRFLVYLKAGLWGMEALVFLGAFSSFFFSAWMLFQGNTDALYFDSMGMLLFLVMFGRELEKKAKLKAKEKLFSYTKTLPKKARLCTAQNEMRFVPIETIKQGDKIKVWAGEKIPLDGEVIEGEGAVDESLMTGESLPRWKKEKESVLGGSLLKRGNLTVAASKNSEETFLSKIIEIIEMQIKEKKRRFPVVDKVSSFFTPSVVLLSLSTFAILALLGAGKVEAFSRALTICLIGCPCALGIAVPIAEAFLIARLAELKVIVRNRQVLPFLGEEKAYVFDKTGTVTYGTFTVKGTGTITDEERGIIKGLALSSRHPVSVALSFALPGPSASLTFIEEIQGRGMKGMYRGSEVLLGSALFLKEKGIEIPSKSYEGIGSLIYFAREGKCLETLILEDKVRSGIKKALNHLKGLDTYLLSGDSRDAVCKVAGLCGFDAWQAEASPLEKREAIKKLQDQKGVVAMIGDGINDAPALSLADVGISTKGALDLALHASDLIVTGHGLNYLPAVRKLGAKANRIIKQNLIWAFGYNICALASALLGTLSPLAAVFAMTTSSLGVIANAARLLPSRRRGRRG